MGGNIANGGGKLGIVNGGKFADRSGRKKIYICLSMQ